LKAQVKPEGRSVERIPPHQPWPSKI